METDRALRLSNLHRLRCLAGDRTANIQIMSAHDPWELQRYGTR
jgi:hypothetical protein